MCALGYLRKKCCQCKGIMQKNKPPGRLIPFVPRYCSLLWLNFSFLAHCILCQADNLLYPSGFPLVYVESCKLRCRKEKKIIPNAAFRHFCCTRKRRRCSNSSLGGLTSLKFLSNKSIVIHKRILQWIFLQRGEIVLFFLQCFVFLCFLFYAQCHTHL